MTKGRVVSRSIGVRRTTIPSRTIDRGITSGFTSLLAKLGLASAELRRARPRHRG